MSVLLEEAAPVVLRQLIRPLMQLAGFAVALGIIYNLHNFVRATVGGIVGVVGRVPGIGRIISSPISAVYHWMDSEFGKAEQFLDARMASSMHELARLVEWVGHEIKSHADLLLTLSQLAANPFSLPLWKAYFHELLKIAHGSIQAIKHASTGYIGAAIHAAIRPIQGELHALERWTYPRVKSLEREITHDIPQDIAGLRARAKTIEGELARAYAAVRAGEARWAAIAFAGAVALALSRLGLGWLRCSSLGNIGRKLGCGGFGLIESLLGDVFQAFAVLDICDFAYGAQVLALELEPLLLELVDVEDALIGCHGATALPALTMRALHLPPTNLGLPLAA